MARETFPNRGTGIDPGNRFTGREIELDGDERDHDAATGEGARVRTRVYRDTSRTVISRNTSPDIPFDVSLNPYRGCEHGCSYCLVGDTLILMADTRQKPIVDLQVGDRIVGTERCGHDRRLVETTVIDHWKSLRPAFRVRLSDGTTIVASGDHRFLTYRGWKHVTGSTSGADRRPHLTTNDTVLRLATGARVETHHDDAYRQGYVTGMVRGDGHLASYDYNGRRRRTDRQAQFRVALRDTEALDRLQTFLLAIGITTWRRMFAARTTRRHEMIAIGTHARRQVEAVAKYVVWPDRPCSSWSRGFLAGIFDAEGSRDGSVARFHNGDGAIIERVIASLRDLALPFTMDRPKLAPNVTVQCVRLRGGMETFLRFVSLTDPAITRKRTVVRHALKRAQRASVTCIEPLGVDLPMYDITTGTGDFIANGMVSHNCYARPTHEYLGLSAGLDFERMLFAKLDAPELLATELAKPSWVPKHLALSGVTDPYQPIERRLRVTRGCLEVLAAHRQPVGVITKNALVTRDLDLLSELARFGAARVMVSITTLDEDLRRRLEPRTSTAADRLRAVRELAAAGVDVGVNVAPIIPGLNDHEIPAILEAAAEAGAHGAAWTLLRLPHAVEEIFVAWLREHAPLRAERVLARLREARGGALSDARFGRRMRGEGVYARQIKALFDVHRRRVGLDRGGAALDGSHFRVPGRSRQPSLFTADEA